MIEVIHLRKSFTTYRGEDLRAVNGISFAVPKGEVYGLLGPNGAGKTTTLRMLAGLMEPTGGQIRINGIEAADAARNFHDPLLLKKNIGFLTANTGLYQRLTTREVLHYFGELRGIYGADLNAHVDSLVKLMSLQEFADRRCEGLSTGQRQRAQIARSLIGNPPVLILDEPTLGLDVLSNQLILNFIREAGRQGRTIILSTHFLDDVETVATRFGLLYQGRLMAEGTLEQLRAASGKTRLSDIFRELVERVDQGRSAQSVGTGN